MEKYQVWVPRNSDWIINSEDGLIDYYSKVCKEIQSVDFVSTTELCVTYIDRDSVCGEHADTADYCDCESWEFFGGSLKEIWENRL